MRSRNNIGKEIELKEMEKQFGKIEIEFNEIEKQPGIFWSRTHLDREKTLEILTKSLTNGVLWFDLNIFHYAQNTIE